MLQHNCLIFKKNKILRFLEVPPKRAAREDDANHRPAVKGFGKHITLYIFESKQKIAYFSL